MVEARDWLRVRGLGRERFAAYVADYLSHEGFSVAREDRAEPAESEIKAELGRMNPAVPSAARAVRFRLIPTSGGAALYWEAPTEIPARERAQMERFGREFAAHLERAISTESHGTAHVTRAPTGRWPWDAEAPAPKSDV
jgi:hypothetical protein